MIKESRLSYQTAIFAIFMPRRMRCFQTASKGARSGGSGGVAGQVGRAADGEVEVVEGGQRAPVADADDDAVGQAVAD